MVMPSRATGVIVTASGFCTRPLTTYSRKACMTGKTLRGCCGLGRLLDEAGDGIAGLRALAEPILRAFEVELHVVGFFLGPISAEFFNELPVARAAAIGHDNAKNRVVLGPDTLH